MSGEIEQKKIAALKLLLERQQKSPSNPVDFLDFYMTNLKITYEFLHDYDHADYEISGYNGQKFSRKRLCKNLRMLRKISNHF